MTTPLHSEKIHDLLVEIFPDEDPQNPRKDYDHLGFMVCKHKRYMLGDEGHGIDTQNCTSWEDVFTRIVEAGGTIIIPIYMYDHSGLTIRTTPFSCPWDSGQIGHIFTTPERIRNYYGVKRITKKCMERARKTLLGEVEEYDQYLRGDVYGYTIKDETGEVLESCWGFYGYDYVRKEAYELAVKIANKNVVGAAV